MVDCDSIPLSPLHIKLGLMKQFVKALDKNCDCFRNICSRFLAISREKVRDGIFDRPEIQTLIKDPALVLHMSIVESTAWCSYVSAVKEFQKKNKGRLLPGCSETVAYKLSSSWGQNEHKNSLLV